MKNILIIEDNEDLRENTAEILEMSNYKASTAENGKIGVKKAKEILPDLIICDIMMPELDGFGVLYALSKDTNTARIPFIFLTAKSERADFRKGMNLGADDFLVKPFDEMELLEAIESRLKKSEIVNQGQEDNASASSAFKGAGNLEDLVKLSKGATRKHYKKKAIIFSEGTNPNNVYFINSGKVKIYKMNEEGKEYITSLHKGGEFIGYLDLLEESPYRSSAETMEETEITAIPRHDFYEIILQNKDIAQNFIKLLSKNLAEKEEQLLNLAYNSVRKKVAEALILIYDRYRDNSEEEFTISREDIANLAGTAKETVIRMLADFKEENLISIQGTKISIQNYQKLAHLRN